MQLSNDQAKAVEDIQKFLNAAHREQVLTGGPGMGKSFLTAKVIEMAEEAGYDVILAATTHPAVEVLANFTGRDVTTIHKLLDLKVKTDYVTNTTHIEKIITAKGEKILEFLSWNTPTLLVVDEASYIDDEIHEYILELLEKYEQIRVLYVGDKYQLPPVDSIDPHVFHIGLTTNQLTTDHRFSSDSQMADIVCQLRDNIEDKSYLLVPIETGNDITVMQPKAFLDKMEELYKSQEYADDPYYVKSLAYRNKVVDKMNNHIRDYFYDETGYHQGERLLVNSPLVRKGKVLANNGEVVTIIDFYDDEIRGVKCTTVKFRRPNGDRFVASICHQPRKKNMVRKELADQKAWTPLYNFMESFIAVKPVYASTVHKAQGASYKNVLLNLEDLTECQDHTLLARLLLVAVSRASEHVYVYGTVPSHLMRS